jgi:hypothetical protein
VAPAAEADPTPVVETAPAPAIAATPAPVHDPIVVPPAPAPAAVDLGASLQQAGLVMIETSSAAPAPSVAEAAPKLGRKPRPAQTIASEPLQMVETRQD